MIYKVLEGSSSVITMYLKDASGNPVPSTSLSSAVFTLKDQATNAVINSRTNVDILNAGPGTIDTAGLVTVNLVAADNAVVGSNREETHVATFKFVSGSTTIRQELSFIVENIDV